MVMKQNRKVCFYLGLIIGVVVDGILRLVSGDEGNLLVHAAVFLGSAVIAMLIISGFLQLRKRVKNKLITLKRRGRKTKDFYKSHNYGIIQPRR